MSKLILDSIERIIIINYYKNPGYWRKNIIVQQYETLKSKRELDRMLKKFVSWIYDAFERSLCWKYIDKIMRAVEKPSNID